MGIELGLGREFRDPAGSGEWSVVGPPHGVGVGWEQLKRPYRRQMERLLLLQFGCYGHFSRPGAVAGLVWLSEKARRERGEAW